jgi:hypothetical protein
MEDESRTFERDVRLHRDCLKPPTTSLPTRLRVAHRVRISIKSLTQKPPDLHSKSGNQSGGQVKMSTKPTADPKRDVLCQFVPAVLHKYDARTGPDLGQVVRLAMCTLLGHEN